MPFPHHPKHTYTGGCLSTMQSVRARFCTGKHKARQRWDNQCRSLSRSKRPPPSQRSNALRAQQMKTTRQHGVHATRASASVRAHTQTLIMCMCNHDPHASNTSTTAQARKGCYNHSNCTPTREHKYFATTQRHARTHGHTRTCRDGHQQYKRLVSGRCVEACRVGGCA